MRKLILSAAALLATSPLSAAVVVDTQADVATLTGSNGSYQVDFGAIVNGSNVAAVNSRIVFSLKSISGNTATIGYTISNLTQAGWNARLSNFGFRVTGGTLVAQNQTGRSTSTGTYGLSFTGTHEYPQSQGRPVSICFKADGNSNCNNGQLGLTAGQSMSQAGEIVLRFQNTVDRIALDNFTVRYQSLGQGNNANNSGVGYGQVVMINAVPEPASWAMMIAGFGLAGAALRSRRRAIAFA